MQGPTIELKVDTVAVSNLALHNAWYLDQLPCMTLGCVCRSTGVEEIAETGVPFDPLVHEAIMMVREFMGRVSSWGVSS